MFGRIGKLFSGFRKAEKSDFIQLNEKNVDKEYIIKDDSEYFDHPEPKVMSEEEINMARQVTDKLFVEESEQISPSTFKMADGREVAAEALKDLLRNPEADNFIIPGQRPRGQAAPTPARNHVPQRNPNSDFETPINVQQAPGEIIVPVQGSHSTGGLPPYFLYTTDDSFFFFIELPGTIKDKLRVKLNDRSLTISGEYMDFSEIVKAHVKSKKTTGKVKKDPIVSKKSNVNRQPEFKHSFTLPKAVDEQNIVATFTEIPGVLLLQLPFKAVSDDVTVTIL